MQYTNNKLIKSTERFLGTDIAYLASGGFWLSIAKFVGVASALILSIAYAHYIPKEVYGNYRYLLSIFGALSFIALPSMGSSITRSVARGYDATYKRGLQILFYASLFISATLIGFSLYFFANNNTTFGLGFLVGALLIPGVEGLGSWRAYLDGKKQFKRKSIFNIIDRITHAIGALSAIAIIIFYSLSTTYTIIVLMMFTLGASTVINIIFSYLNVRSVPKNALYEKGSIMYGIKLSVSDILVKIAAYIDGVLLFQFLGPVALATYTFAIAPVEQLKSFLTSAHILALPKFATTSQENVKQTLIPKIAKMMLLIGFGVLTYILLAPILYKYLFPQYLESAFYSQIFALSLFTFPVGIILASFEAFKKLDLIYGFKIISPLLQIIVIAIGVWQFGIIGAIVGKVLGRFLSLFVSILFLKFS